MPNAEEIKISQTSQTTVATALSSLSTQLKSKADIGEVYTKDEVDEITDELYLDIKKDLKKDYIKKLSSKQNAEEGKGLSTNDFTDELKEKLESLDKGTKGEQGQKGEKGDAGLSAYDLAVQRGYSGTLSEWLKSLKGDAGERGKTGKAGRDGKDGLDGQRGADGLSAYEIAKKNGFRGTEQEWLTSLKGKDGVSRMGMAGASAYQIAVRNGFKGTEKQWLQSLKGSGTGGSNYDDTEIQNKLEELKNQITQSKQDLTYLHIQERASSEWSITHSLGKYPSVSIIDTAGSQVEGEVTYISLNEIKIEFSSPFSGKATLN